MFNPTQLDPNQWADAAVSAGMKFGVLTTRHHDGFALWDSQVSTFDVGSIPWQNGKGDVVRAYVDAFRATGLLPGLYYSVWDSTHPVGGTSTSDSTPVTADQLAYVKAQLTELLTNYGKIPLLIFDGWAWKMGHRQVPYQEIRALVKSLQPDCLMLDNSHLMSPWENDIAGVEEAQGNAFVPADNTFPAVQMQKINADRRQRLVLGAQHRQPHDRRRRSSTSTSSGSSRCGRTSCSTARPTATACCRRRSSSRLARSARRGRRTRRARRCPRSRRRSTSRTTRSAPPRPAAAATYAVDGKDDWYTYSVWEPSGALPQAITVDLGQERPDVSVLNYVPRYVAQVGPSADGAITSYNVYVSTDNATFTMVASGDWPANGLMKTASFDPVAARYVRLEATAANGSTAAATEIAVGARR